MPIKLKAPLIEHFPLDKSDAHFENTGTATIVKIRAANQGEEEERQSLFALTDKRVDVEGDLIYRSWVSMDDVWRKEVFLTLADCNIEGDDGQPLFSFKNNRLTDEKEFRNAWGKLDPFIANEIIEKVHEVNKQWGPQGKA